MAQFLRPSSDITNPANWNGTFADIDEVTANDSDFGYSDDRDDLTYETALSSVTDPLSAAGHTVRCRISRSDGGVPNQTGGSASSVQILLMQNALQIAEIRADADVGAWEDVVYTLSTAEANNITSYSSLRVRFVITGGGGSPANRRGVAVSWVEMEVPNAIGVLAGSSDGVATVTGEGEVSGIAQIASSINPSATTDGILGGIFQISSAINTSSTTQGNLTIAPALIFGVSNGIATVQGTGNLKGNLLGVSNGLAVTDATISFDSFVFGLGQSNGQTTINATLIYNQIFGVINGKSTITGYLNQTGSLSGTINGSTSLDVTFNHKITSLITPSSTLYATFSEIGNISGSSNSGVFKQERYRPTDLSQRTVLITDNHEIIKWDDWRANSDSFIHIFFKGKAVDDLRLFHRSDAFGGFFIGFSNTRFIIGDGISNFILDQVLPVRFAQYHEYELFYNGKSGDPNNYGYLKIDGNIVARITSTKSIFPDYETLIASFTCFRPTLPGIAFRRYVGGDINKPEIINDYTEISYIKLQFNDVKRELLLNEGQGSKLKDEVTGQDYDVIYHEDLTTLSGWKTIYPEVFSLRPSDIRGMGYQISYSGYIKKIRIGLSKVGNPDYDIALEIYNSTTINDNNLLWRSSKILKSKQVSNGFNYYDWDLTLIEALYTVGIGGTRLVLLRAENDIKSDENNTIHVYTDSKTNYNALRTTTNGTNFSIFGNNVSLVYQIESYQNYGFINQTQQLYGRIDTVSNVEALLRDSNLFINAVASITGIATVTGILADQSNLQGFSSPLGTKRLEVNTFTSFYIGVYERYGQKFDSFEGAIKRVAFRMEKSGSPDHDLVAEIWNISGGLPNTLLQTSKNTVAASSLSDNPSGDIDQIFFEFEPTYYDEALAVVVRITNVTLSDFSNRVLLAINSSNLDSSEVLVRDNGSWASVSTWELAHEIERTYVFGTLDGNQTMVGVVNGSTTTTADLSGIGGNDLISGSSDGDTTTSGTLTALGQLIGVITTLTTTSSTLSGIAGLVGVINTSTTTQGDLIGKSDLLGVINSATTITGALTANGELQGIINASATVNGNANARGDLDSGSNGSTTTSGTLSANGSLSGDSNGVTTTSGLLNSNLQGSVVVNTTTNTTATLTGTGALLGTSNGSATTSGFLTSIQPISGESNGSTTTSGTLNSNGVLEGVSNGATTTTGVLSATGSLGGSSNGSTTTQGNTVSNAMLGISNGTSTTSGTLTGTANLVGETNGVASLSGLLNSNLQGEVVVNTDTMTSGTLTATGALVGESNGITTTSGDLGSTLDAEGESNGSSTTSGTLTGNGSISGIINSATTTQGTLTSNGALSGSSNGSTTTTPTLSSEASLNAIINTSTTVTGILTGSGQLAGTSNGLTTTSGVINSNLLGSVVVNTDTMTSGTLTGTGALSGIINSSTTVQGNLGSESEASGESNGSSTTNGTLSANGSLSGTINSTTTVQGNIMSRGDLEGISNGVTTTSGVLTSIGSLNGTINTSTTVQGTLVSDAMLGVSNGSTVTNGVLTANGSLAGSASGQASTSGSLISDAIAGITNGTATTQGVLTAKGTLAGNSNGSTTTQGETVEGNDIISGISNGTSTTSGTLTGTGNLNGESNGSSTGTGNTASSGQISGISNGVTTTSATLTAKGSLAGVSEPEPEFFDLSEGSLIAKFFTDDESYGETLDIKNKAVRYIEFFLGKTGSPNFEMRAEIWSLDGSRLPDTLLQTSINTLQATDVPEGVYAYYRFDFDIVGVNYNQEVAIVIHITNHTVGDDDNYIERIYGDGNPFRGGNIVYNFTGLLWTENLDQDINGRIQLAKGVKGNLTGTIFGVSFGTTTVTGFMESVGILEGISNGDAGVYGVMSHRITGTSNGTTTTSGTLIGKGILVGESNGSTTTIGSLLSDGALSGVSNGSSSVSGELLGKRQIEGESNGSSSTNGTLTGIGNLEGVVNGTTTTSLENNASIGSLSGVINSSTTVTGILIVKNGGSSDGSSTTSGTLTAKGSLSGTSNGSTLVQGTFLDPIEGISNGSTTVTGTLTAQASLEGVSNGIGIVGGYMTSIIPIEGESNGSTTVTGEMLVPGSLVGVINTYSQTSGTVIPIVDKVVKISGTSNGSSTVTGLLTPDEILDTTCFYEVIYKEPIYYVVEYVQKKYYVNYNCKN